MPLIKLDGKSIQSSDSVKYLGMTVSSDLRQEPNLKALAFSLTYVFATYVE